MAALMKAIVLFAHGSRDPQWHLPMVAVKERIALSHPDALVACAYLELSPPDLSTVVASFHSQGVTEIRVVPMFLGVGKHVRHDLPLMMDEIKSQYPHIHFECMAAVGEHPELLDLLAKIAWA
jgi:sirohydrochlorin cobaltochelatase